MLDRYAKLEGYELYIVEQWVCSRKHPTFVIATYTGDASHSIHVGVLGVPANKEEWSPRLRLYFQASSEFQARPKETPLGMLMVTNLSNFPSALTVISVPEGDVRKHREDFIVNENLKRLGCSGRSGMSLSAPAGATQAKFSQLYKTSDRVPPCSAVIELVQLCQVALIAFGKLEEEYLDGLLCDMTEKAIADWWIEIGSEFYNSEPTDGILGPTTVAALLGTLMGARNRLNYLNAPVAKDAFDYQSLQRGIKYFQKNQKMRRTGKLDRETLHRLHNTTAKAAAGEGWAVPKAVKSTVAELSGKGGEMVMGMVGRDKAGIGDVETLDIDRFVQLVHGDRAKWLWLGKGKRSGHTNDGKPENGPANLNFSRDDHGGYIWSNNRTEKPSHEEEKDIRKKEKDTPTDIYSAFPPGSATSMVDSPYDKDPQLRKTVIKSVTGKMSDATSRFGRIKDAVGLRGHTSRHSKDDGVDVDGKILGQFSPSGSTHLANSPSIPQSPEQGVGKAFTWKITPSDYQNGSPKIKDRISNVVYSARLRGSESPPTESKVSITGDDIPEDGLEEKDIETDLAWTEQVKDIREALVVTDPSIGGSVYDDGDLEGPVLVADRDPKSFQVLLRRRHSTSGSSSALDMPRNDAWWPRQMSFSDAEDAVLGWEPIVTMQSNEASPWAGLQIQKYMSETFKQLFEKVSVLQDSTGPWVESQVNDVDSLDVQAERDLEMLQTRLHQLDESHQAMKHSSRDILGEERSHVTEMVKDIEVLGAKLEYEINALVSKVQDVEEGVSQYERQVIELEIRARVLEDHLSSETWAHWAVRSITGIGTPPNRKASSLEHDDDGM